MPILRERHHDEVPQQQVAVRVCELQLSVRVPESAEGMADAGAEVRVQEEEEVIAQGFLIVVGTLLGFGLFASLVIAKQRICEWYIGREIHRIACERGSGHRYQVYERHPWLSVIHPE